MGPQLCERVKQQLEDMGQTLQPPTEAAPAAAAAQGGEAAGGEEEQEEEGGAQEQAQEQASRKTKKVKTAAEGQAAAAAAAPAAAPAAAAQQQGRRQGKKQSAEELEGDFAGVPLLNVSWPGRGRLCVFVLCTCRWPEPLTLLNRSFYLLGCKAAACSLRSHACIPGIFLAAGAGPGQEDAQEGGGGGGSDGGGGGVPGAGGRRGGRAAAGEEEEGQEAQGDQVLTLVVTLSPCQACMLAHAASLGRMPLPQFKRVLLSCKACSCMEG